MSQFTCDICCDGFEQRSALERHMQTSHPPQAPSAADLERALAEAAFPASRQELVSHAAAAGHDAIADLLRQLPQKHFRDAAEVARAFGELRSHQPGARHQPSRLGGERALTSDSAAAVASLFAGVDLPADAEQLRRHAHNRSDDDRMHRVIERFRPGRYRSMADIGREIGHAMSAG